MLVTALLSFGFLLFLGIVTFFEIFLDANIYQSGELPFLLPILAIAWTLLAGVILFLELQDPPIISKRWVKWLIYWISVWSLEAPGDWIGLLHPSMALISNSDKSQLITIMSFFIGFSALIVTFRLADIQSVITERERRKNEGKGRTIWLDQGGRSTRRNYLNFDKIIFSIYALTLLSLFLSALHVPSCEIHGIIENAPSFIITGIASCSAPHLVVGSIIASFVILGTHILYRRNDI